MMLTIIIGLLCVPIYLAMITGQVHDVDNDFKPGMWGLLCVPIYLAFLNIMMTMITGQVCGVSVYMFRYVGTSLRPLIPLYLCTHIPLCPQIP